MFEDDEALDCYVAEAEGAVAQLLRMPHISGESLLRACENFAHVSPPLSDVVHCIGQVACWLFVDLNPGSGFESLPPPVKVAVTIAEGQRWPYNYINVSRCSGLLHAARIPDAEALEISPVLRVMVKWAIAVCQYFLATCLETGLHPETHGDPEKMAAVVRANSKQSLRVKRSSPVLREASPETKGVHLTRTGQRLDPMASLGTDSDADGNDRNRSPPRFRNRPLDRSSLANISDDVVNMKLERTMMDGSTTSSNSAAASGLVSPPKGRRYTAASPTAPNVPNCTDRGLSPRRLRASTATPTSNGSPATRSGSGMRNSNATSDVGVDELQILREHLRRHHKVVGSAERSDYTRSNIMQPMKESVFRKALDDIRNNRVRSVDLRDCGLFSEECVALCHALSQNYSVLSLDLAHNTIGADGGRELVHCLRNGARNLRHLCLEHTGVPDTMLERVRELCDDRSEYAVTSEALSQLRMDNVRELDLSRRCLTDTGAKQILEACARTRVLRSIDLSYNEIGQEGAEEALRLMDDNGHEHGVTSVSLVGNSAVPSAHLHRLEMLCSMKLMRGPVASASSSHQQSHSRPTTPSVVELDFGGGGSSSTNSAGYYQPRTLSPLRSRNGGLPPTSSPRIARESSPRTPQRQKATRAPSNPNDTPSPNSACPLRRVASIAILRVRQQLGFTEEELWSMFNELDKSGQGYLDKAVFRRMYLLLEHFGVPVTSESVDDMLARYNMLGPTKLSFEEFAIIMLKVAQR
eukprot:PhM_4_TR3642/c0_g1_i1/m.32510